MLDPAVTINENATEEQLTSQDFVSDVRALFSPLQSEVAARNKRVQDNDQYIYGDLLSRMLDIPIGHDMTPVNWLRRTVEIHRAQFMGKGFGIDSSYIAEDISSAGDDKNEEQRLVIENQKKKAYAEARRSLIEGIIRDNDGDAFWANAAENASAVGDTVVKAWFDRDSGKYKLQQIETIDNFYALWARDDYRVHNAVAYVHQISKEDAIELYGVSQNVPTSPLGTPLVVLSSANLSQYVSSQPMVTVMEITGKIEGWCSYDGNLRRCLIGDETELNAVIVGDTVYQLIDDPKDIPHYYILPNKRARRRPWGISDVSNAAVQINLTYIEALSDWRTVASKVNFPKFKAFGFPPGVQAPKPKGRTVEFIPLVAGQDIQPITMGQSAGSAESDFIHQLTEMENQFVREVGISRQLFDMPDVAGNSNPAMITAMKSVSDLTNAKRALWEPIISQIFTDALKTLALHDSNINEVVNQDSDWFVKINWPSALNTDDPSYHAMQINRFNAGTLSLQSYLESLGDDKQEIDRIREEMKDPITAAIHGHSLPELAHFTIYDSLGIPLWGFNQPKISLKGDLTPQQEGNMADLYGWQNGPYGDSIGPQGTEATKPDENVINQGFISGSDGSDAKYGMPTGITPGKPLPRVNPNTPGAQQQPPQPGAQPATQPAPQPGSGQPEMINGAVNNTGNSIISQPGSGAPATSAMGKMKQHNQRRGR